MPNEILTVIQEVLAPMVAADGGRLYVVQADSKQVCLHLAGRFAGCPGNQVTTRRIIQPVIAAIAPGAELTVTWGRLVPMGATRVEALPVTDPEAPDEPFGRSDIEPAPEVNG